MRLNWTSPYAIDFASFCNPLHYLACNKAWVPRDGSLMIDHLEWEGIEALKRFPSRTDVMRIIAIHVNPAYGAKTGLSAALGDARVQPVDVSKEARINAPFSLVERCQRIGHATIPQELHRDSAVAVTQPLKGVVIKYFGSNSEQQLVQVLCSGCAPMCTNNSTMITFVLRLHRIN